MSWNEELLAEVYEDAKPKHVISELGPIRTETGYLNCCSGHYEFITKTYSLQINETLIDGNKGYKVTNTYMIGDYVVNEMEPA